MTFTKQTPKVLFLIAILFSIATAIWLLTKEEEKGKGAIRSNTITYGSTIKNNPYRLHVQVGKDLIGKPFGSNKEVFNEYSRGALKKVSGSRGILIDDLTHSLPYLHPYAETALKEIGKKFHSKTNGNRMVINSLTRSVEGQRLLTKTNSNASPNTSSHSYAVSFDIAYSKFNRNRLYDHFSHQVLETILKEFQAKGRIYVIREKQSACYHVTVRNKSDWKE